MKKLLALFLSLVLLLSACSSVSGSVSGPGNSQSSEDTEPGTKGKLSILYMSGPYADSARAMAEEFTERLAMR